MRRFYEKELLLSKVHLSYYLELDSHIKDKVKVVLDLSNYAAEKKFEYASGVGTSNLRAKKIIALKLNLINWALIY